MPKERVYFDYNIFCNIDRINGLDACLLALRSTDVGVCRSVELVQEAGRDPDPSRRLRLLRLIKQVAAHSLLPSTYYDCQDVVGEIIRVRPEWLRAEIQRSRLKRRQRAWRKELRTIDHDDYSVLTLAGLQEDEISRSKAHHRKFREYFTSDTFELCPTFDAEDRHLTQAVRDTLPSAVRSPSELRENPLLFLSWIDFRTRRLLFDEGCGSLFDGHRRLRDISDWLSPHLRRGRPPSRIAWARFCFLEVDVAHLQGRRLLSGLHLAQQLFKFDAGNIGDLAHAEHIPRVRAFLTSDKQFEWCVKSLPKNVRPGNVHLVQPDNSDLLEILRFTTGRRRGM